MNTKYQPCKKFVSLTVKTKQDSSTTNLLVYSSLRVINLVVNSLLNCFHKVLWPRLWSDFKSRICNLFYGVYIFFSLPKNVSTFNIGCAQNPRTKLCFSCKDKSVCRADIAKTCRSPVLNFFRCYYWFVIYIGNTLMRVPGLQFAFVQNNTCIPNFVKVFYLKLPKSFLIDLDWFESKSMCLADDHDGLIFSQKSCVVNKVIRKKSELSNQ